MAGFKPTGDNEHWYTSMDDARQKTEEWRQLYNIIKPHSKLGKKTPKEYALLHAKSTEHGQDQGKTVETNLTGVLS